jgi:large subunit ribosomal protein L29
MKARDLRDRSTEDLAELEKSLLADSFQNRFKNFTNRLDDTSVIKKSKRDVARVKLILAERARGVTVVYKTPEVAPAKPKTRPPKPAPKAAEVEAADDPGKSPTGETESAEAGEKEAPAKKKAAKPAAKAAPAAKAKAKAEASDKPAAKKPKAKTEKSK